MADFVEQYIVIEPFYSTEVRESVFNGYPKFIATLNSSSSHNSSYYI